MACGDTNDFIIPKGLAFDFTVQVLQDNSFLPQPLDAFLSGSLTLIDMDTGVLVPGVAPVALTKLTEEVIPEIPLVMEETTLTIANADFGTYSVTIGATSYSVDYPNGTNVKQVSTVDITGLVDLTLYSITVNAVVYSLTYNVATHTDINGYTTALAALVNASADVTATALLNTITITALTAGTPYTISTSSATLLVLTETQANVIFTPPADTNTIATDLFAQMSVLPVGITVTNPLATANLVIKETTGATATITYSTNIVKSAYVAGTEFVAGYTSTAYNDNGYLKGTIPALDTAKLTVERGDVVDGYYLKPAYQGVLQVLFSDTTPSKTALICEIYVVNTGN